MGLKLLVADDEDTIRMGVAKYIRLHSDRFTKIYEAENGQQALDLILQHQPELLLLDVQMPLRNGIEVLQEAGKAGVHPLTVILSGYDEFKYAQQAIHCGAKEYLLKPVRARDILDCLNRLADAAYGAEYSVPETEGQEQDNRFVRMAQDYIAEHFSEDLSLTEVAEKAGISPAYLSSLFTQKLNCRFVDYLTTVRIERACTYLTQHYLKTYEIAYKVGFRDEKYFSRVFRKMKGMSPKEYREKGDLGDSGE